MKKWKFVSKVKPPVETLIWVYNSEKKIVETFSYEEGFDFSEYSYTLWMEHSLLDTPDLPNVEI